LYSANPALPGGSRRWEQSVRGQTTTIGAHVLLPLSVSQQRFRTKNWFTASAGPRTCDRSAKSLPKTQTKTNKEPNKMLQSLNNQSKVSVCDSHRLYWSSPSLVDVNIRRVASHCRRHVVVVRLTVVCRAKTNVINPFPDSFIDLGCLYCKQTQRAFNVLKNTQN
jgi:hypothetical protein